MTRNVRIGLTLVAVALSAGFAMLGSWQLHRGQDKQRRLQQHEAVLDSGVDEALAQAVRDAGSDGAIRRVAGKARFEAPLLLLDNQQRRGRVGLRVYAVARADASPARILVDLGWVPLAPDRSLPQLELPAGEHALRGLLVPWPGQGLRVAPNPWPATPARPVLLNYLDPREIETALGIELAPAVLRLAPGLALGYQRDLELLPNTLPPQRHYGYAVQWYALAATVIVVWLVLSVRARRARGTTRRDSAA